MKLPHIFAALSALVLADPAVAIAGEADIERGKRVVEANCSRCHATGPDGASHHPEAPPFRDVVKRYPPEMLAEALAEGISSGHPDMPEFVFEPGDIGAIIAYLNELKTP
jgi:cytochrome c